MKVCEYVQSCYWVGKWNAVLLLNMCINCGLELYCVD